MKRKNIFITLLITFVILGLFIGLKTDVIFQEGNPVNVAKGIAQLLFNGKSFCMFSEKPEKYVIKADRYCQKSIKEIADSKKIDFVEQMGAGLIFKTKNNTTVHAEIRMFTTSFMVIEFSNNKK